MGWEILPPEVPAWVTTVDDSEKLRRAIARLIAAAENLLTKHKLGAVTEADVRWMETELSGLK